MAVAMLSTPNAEIFTETKECRPNANQYIFDAYLLALFVHVLTFPCLAHGSCVSATLTLVIHAKCPHFTILGQNTCVSLTHSNLSYKVTFKIRHLTCGLEGKMQ